MSATTATTQPKKKYNSYVVLQGPDKEIAKAQLCIGKSVSILIDGLVSNGLDFAQSFEIASERLGITTKALRFFREVHEFYSFPMDQRFMKFEYFFLYTVALKKLYAFIPILKECYVYPDGDMARHVCLTQKSIEVLVPFTDGESKWIHLAELSYENVVKFDKLVGVPKLISYQYQPKEETEPNAEESLPTLDEFTFELDWTDEGYVDESWLKDF